MRTSLFIIILVFTFLIIGFVSRNKALNFLLLTPYKVDEKFELNIDTISNSVLNRKDNYLQYSLEFPQLNSTLEDKYPVFCEYFTRDNVIWIVSNKVENGFIRYFKIEDEKYINLVSFNSKKNLADLSKHSEFNKKIGREIIDSLNIKYIISNDTLTLNFNKYFKYPIYKFNDFSESSPIDTSYGSIEYCSKCIENKLILDTLLLYEKRFNSYSSDRWKKDSPLDDLKANY